MTSGRYSAGIPVPSRRWHRRRAIVGKIDVGLKRPVPASAHTRPFPLHQRRQPKYNPPMATKPASNAPGDRVIAVNRRARHDYFIEDRFEAGLALQGWEVRSLRSGRAQIAEAYVVVRGGEIWLLGARIQPLPSASTHVVPDPDRTRKLLLHRREIDRLIGAVERKGYTLVPLRLYWKHGRAKLEIGLALGKRKHDKRETEKERDWQRQKQRLLRQ